VPRNLCLEAVAFGHEPRGLRELGVIAQRLLDARERPSRAAIVARVELVTRFFERTVAWFGDGRRSSAPVARVDAGRFEPAVYNNAPALKLYLGDSFEGILMVEIADGKVSRLYAMRNPDKLATVLVPRQISR